jgi:sec-independent protein translocase protein TatB
VFGIGGSEILVILVIALLFLGPDKLPEAAKTISKTVRDLKKQGRILQQTIENDEHIGGAIRDLKSALRGDEIVTRPPPKKLAASPTIAKPEDLVKIEAAEAKASTEDVIAEANVEAKAEAAEAAKPDLPAVTLPPTAGEADPDVPERDDHEELAKLVKPAAGVVARDAADTKHG